MRIARGQAMPAQFEHFVCGRRGSGTRFAGAEVALAAPSFVAV